MSNYNASASDTATAAANTEVTATLPANIGTVRGLRQVYANYSGNPTNGLLTIESPSGTFMRRFPISGTEKIIDFPTPGLVFAQNTQVVVRLSAGGAGIIGYLNITPSTSGRAI